MPVHTYTNWNQRPSDQEEQIEPFRKYIFICEGANIDMTVPCDNGLIKIRVGLR